MTSIAFATNLQLTHRDNDFWLVNKLLLNQCNNTYNQQIKLIDDSLNGNKHDN